MPRLGTLGKRWSSAGNPACEGLPDVDDGFVGAGVVGHSGAVESDAPLFGQEGGAFCEGVVAFDGGHFARS